MPSDQQTDNLLLQELRYIDSEHYHIEKIPHLVFDREESKVRTYPNPIIYKEPVEFFTSKEEFILGNHQGCVCLGGRGFLTLRGGRREGEE